MHRTTRHLYRYYVVVSVETDVHDDLTDGNNNDC